MATSDKKPVKGILKNSSSFDKAEPARGKSTQWDEMNIIATLHPADKDYGHMKIEEPKTPYSTYKVADDEEGGERRQSVECISDTEDKETLDPGNLCKRLQEKEDRVPQPYNEDAVMEDDDDEEDLTPEEKARQTEFKNKRKLHYNEFYAKELAKQLMEEDEDDDDDEK